MDLVCRETANLKLTLKLLSSQDEKKVTTVVDGRPRKLGQACESHPTSSAELCSRCSSSYLN